MGNPVGRCEGSSTLEFSYSGSWRQAVTALIDRDGRLLELYVGGRAGLPGSHQGRGGVDKTWTCVNKETG